MFPYLSSPEAGDVEAALCRFEIAPLRSRLEQRLQSGDDDPELRHVLGLLQLFSSEPDSAAAATTNLEHAYQALRERSQPRKACLVAISLGRLHHDGTGDQPVGNGWLARALALVESEEPCVEQGWALIPLVGCNVADTGQLQVDAARALQIARQFDDVELECKALADSGLALVSLGRVSAGMACLDQAMVMLRSGECPGPMVASAVVCDLLSACQRASDLPRAESWLAALEEMGALQPPDRRPSFLFTHCRIAYGAVLCEMGRWTEAEVALRLSASLASRHGRSNQVAGAAALADLLVQQGRLDGAAALLEGNDDRVDALTPLARLHLARGMPELAAAVARQGLRMLGGDRLRAARLLALLVEADLAARHEDGAETAAARLDLAAAESELPVIAALAAQARGRIAVDRGQIDEARRCFEMALAELQQGGWPLLRGSLHLELARLHASTDRSSAIAEARVALTIFQRIDASGAERARALLETLGEQVRPARPAVHPLDVLTRREREVFDLLAMGHANQAIAQRLFITLKTAEHHVSSILSKLGLRSRAEVAAYAATMQVAAPFPQGVAATPT